jgi:hypothetical protein
VTSKEARLAEYEAIIARNPKEFAVVGLQLAAIHEQRLYPQATFTDYCEERWNLMGRRGWQFVVSARAVAQMKAEGLPAPANEYQARILACVPERNRVAVWLQAIELGGGTADSRTVAQARAAAEAEERRQLNADAPGQAVPGLRGRAGRRLPQRRQREAITAGIAHLQGLCAGFEQLNQIDPAITTEEAAQWVRDLSEPLRVLRGLTTKLKEHTHASH